MLSDISTQYVIYVGDVFLDTFRNKQYELEQRGVVLDIGKNVDRFEISELAFSQNKTQRIFKLFPPARKIITNIFV